MSFEDTQMDVLLRRYSKDTKSSAVIEHLDADELSAFAEGSLPATARSRCVSHLADCDDCRRLFSQLAISAGALAKAEPARTLAKTQASWLQRLAAFFRPPALRYAAFAALVIAAAGVGLLVLRQTQRTRESTLLAQNEPAAQTRVNAAQHPEEPSSETAADNRAADVSRPSASSQPTPNANLGAEREGLKTTDNPAAPPKPQKEAAEPATLTDKKIAELPATEPKPAYAPPPPEESQRARVETKSGEQQMRPSVASATTQGGAGQSGQFAGLDRQQSGQLSTAKQSKDDNNRVAQNQLPINGRVMNEKAKGPRRDVDNVAPANRSADEARPPAPKTEDAEAGKRTTSREESETRSVGGHKFRRQGSAWIDAKFKSSMSLKNVSRGSEEFAALDSGLRSIAQQLNGEIIIVWKGKAYVIR